MKERMKKIAAAMTASKKRIAVTATSGLLTAAIIGGGIYYVGNDTQPKEVTASIQKALATPEKEKKEPKKETLTEKDIKDVVTGIEDHYVLADTKQIDYLYNVFFDDKYVEDVFVDVEKVDLSKPGDYPVTYTVLAKTEELRTYLDDKKAGKLADSKKESDKDDSKVTDKKEADKKVDEKKVDKKDADNKKEIAKADDKTKTEGKKDTTKATEKKDDTKKDIARVADKKSDEKKVDDKKDDTKIANKKTDDKKADNKKVDEKKGTAKAEDKKSDDKKADDKATDKKTDEKKNTDKATDKKADDKKDADKAEEKKVDTTDIKVEVTLTVVDKATAQGLADQGKIVWVEENSALPKADGTEIKLEAKAPETTQEFAAPSTSESGKKVAPKQTAQAAGGNGQGANVGKHKHNWVKVTETIHHPEQGHYITHPGGEYDQPIYETQAICNWCGANISEDTDHIAWCGPWDEELQRPGGSSYRIEDVIVGYEHIKDPDWQEYVVDSYEWTEWITRPQCTICGAKK